MNLINRTAAVCLLVIFTPAGAWAGPACTDIFAARYPASQTENFGNCQTCHVTASGGSTFNAYGADLRANGASGAGFGCTGTDFDAALLAVEGLDSDGEGNSNRAEIDAGTQPGWCDPAAMPGCVNAAGTPPNVPLDPMASSNAPPVAAAGGPYAGEAGSTLIQFDGSASSDPDGDPLTFAWNFGDGSTASGMLPTHTYQGPGTYTVTLVVNDGMTNSAPSTATATISAPVVNLAPSADAGGPYSGEPGVQISLDGSGSSDPNGDSLTYSWSFGDGATGTGPMPAHTYLAEGSYTVSLTVSDGTNVSPPATSTATITAPVAASEGEALYAANCVGCHGDPWASPAVDAALAGLRRIAGARDCVIDGSIFGTAIYPNGVPAMQYLQGLSASDIQRIADYLNARPASGEQRYVASCAGCHGDIGAGGRVGENVRGESAGETRHAISDERDMRYLACMPQADINAISVFLGGSVDDDEDREGSGGSGSPGVPLLLLLAVLALRPRRRAA